MAFHRGFLGSEATRFVAQDTTDIQITDWRNLPVRPLHQRTIAVSQGMSFVSFETLYPFPNPAGGPPILVWLPNLPFSLSVRLICYGASYPNMMGWPQVGWNYLWLLLGIDTLSTAMAAPFHHAFVCYLVFRNVQIWLLPSVEL